MYVYFIIYNDSGRKMIWNKVLNKKIQLKYKYLMKIFITIGKKCRKKNLYYKSDQFSIGDNIQHK